MKATLHIVLLPLLLALVPPALAQKTSQPQEMAKPGESTEPPPPKAAPVGGVQAMSLPRGGGVLVFGGTRGVGLEVVKDLVAAKEQVTVVTHSAPDNAELKALGVTVVSGNALDPDSLKDVFKATPYRVVVSTIGRVGNEPAPDFAGNKNVIDAAKAIGIPRFILVSTLGAGDSLNAVPWIGRLIYKSTFTEKTLAEAYLKSSGLEYTIVRPGGLLNKAPSGQAKLVEDPNAFSWIARADLGKLVAACVDDDKCVKKVYTALDQTRASVFSLLK